MTTKTEIQDNGDCLEVFEVPESDTDQIYTFETDEVTALCPFDYGGPDFYEFKLQYIPDELCIESKSLKKYLESFRDAEITAEELGAEMYESFEATISPDTMYLRLEQARRGGIEETVEYGNRSLRTKK